MHYCTECQTVEGYFDETFLEETQETVHVCRDCGGIETKKNIPDHDHNEER